MRTFELLSYDEAVLDAARRRDVPATCWVLDKRTSECVVRDGAVERLSRVRSADANISARVGDHEGYLTCAVGTDPDRAVDTAVAIATALPPVPPLPAAPSTVNDFRGEYFTGLNDSAVEQLRAIAASYAPVELEVRVRVEGRTVTLATTSGQRLRYQTELASATVRATARGARTVQLTHDHFAGSVAGLLSVLAGPVVREQVEHARLLGTRPVSEAVPGGPVLLHARLAGRVLGLLCPAVGVDAVRQGRSGFTGRLGTAVASPSVSVTEDLTDPRSPLRVPWDDEGTAVARVPVITDGVLGALLADRRYGGVEGSTGCGWRGESGEAPAIRPGFLAVDVAGAALSTPDGAWLEIVQANGMDMANPVTGDFSFAASALLHSPGAGMSIVDGLTVAGNVFELLAGVGGHDGRPALWRTELSFVHSPGIWTSALTIGR